MPKSPNPKSWSQPYKEHVDTIEQKLRNWNQEEKLIRNIFERIDETREGKLEWNVSQIRKFIEKVFESYEIEMPELSESQWYDICFTSIGLDCFHRARIWKYKLSRIALSKHVVFSITGTKSTKNTTEKTTARWILTSA